MLPQTVACKSASFVSNESNDTPVRKRKDDFDLLHYITKKFKASCNISDLPNELLIKIFLKLPTQEILFSVPFVCTRWNCLWTNSIPCWKMICTSRANEISITPELQHVLNLRNANSGENKVLEKIKYDDWNSEEEEYLKLVPCTNCYRKLKTKLTHKVLQKYEKLEKIWFYGNKFQKLKTFMENTATAKHRKLVSVVPAVKRHCNPFLQLDKHEIKKLVKIRCRNATNCTATHLL